MTTEEMTDTPNNALDRPDGRDFDAKYILGADPIVIPDNILLDITEGNQGSVPSCTCYASCHAAQYANELEHQTKLSPYFEKMWELQGEFGTRIPGGGDYVQTALKNLVKNGLVCKDGTVYPIKGYARISAAEIDYWLARKFPIVTSFKVTKTNLKAAKTTGIWGGWEGDRVGGHAVVIMGKEPGYKIVSNSYGSTWGKFGNGTFKVTDKDILTFDSMYILYDENDSAPKPIFKDVMEGGMFAEEIKWAVENKLLSGYTDGRFGPNDPVTRGQLSAILYRMSKNNFFNK